MFVTHESIKPFIDNNSSIMLLGFFPSVKSREEELYHMRCCAVTANYWKTRFFCMKKYWKTRYNGELNCV